MDRLVDILLSLLAYSSAQLPSAPLREAVEAVFRAFAAHLTPTGQPCKAAQLRALSRPVAMQCKVIGAEGQCQACQKLFAHIESVAIPYSGM